MAPKYKTGESVRYKPIGGPNSKTPVSVGTIKSVATEDKTMAGRHVKASADEPRYEIKNDNTGKTAAIAEANILGHSEG